MKSLVAALLTLSALVAMPAAEPERQVYKSIGDTKLEIWIYKPAGWKATDQRPAEVL